MGVRGGVRERQVRPGKPRIAQGSGTGHPPPRQGAPRPAPRGRPPLPIMLLGHRRQPAGSAPPAPIPGRGARPQTRPREPAPAQRVPSSHSESCRRWGLSREGHAGTASASPATSEEKRMCGCETRAAPRRPPEGPARPASTRTPPSVGTESSFPPPAPHHPDTEIGALVEWRQRNQLLLGTSPEIL